MIQRIAFEVGLAGIVWRAFTAVLFLNWTLQPLLSLWLSTHRASDMVLRLLSVL